ncbi:MAG: accessory factor UbiK family protein [Gammaproteobacteria bacterium]|nr:accessory factor UbiK family protein [Gammaproteobacteria bacterium]MCP5424725.1 accessory factor UbiK family protein [Gammaproteobacteria bacterium]MCP5459240.1 accessory factor UbiK family protein [Gammaproteobacteria bacterium]
MIDPKIIDDLSKRFAELVPAGFRQMQADLEKNFHAVLQTAFAKMDLVTREEFDVQQAVLARTRAKLEALEQQVAALEEKAQPRRRTAKPAPPKDEA